MAFHVTVSAILKRSYTCQLVLCFVDVDECGESNCEQLCSNTIGSECYVCGCLPGYRLANDRHSCNGSISTKHCVWYCIRGIILFFFIDIIECSEGVAECEQNCHNNNGSYTCSCSAGYELADDGFHCTGKLYINIHEGKVNNMQDIELEELFFFIQI